MNDAYIGGIAQYAPIDQLSEEQEKVLSIVNDFMHSDQKQLVIGGVAGVGKSTIIPFIKNRYAGTVVCAYTGKAVMVLKRKGIIQAETLHSFLYLKHKVKDQDGNQTIVFYEKTPEYFELVSLLIVDEASMLPKSMYDLIRKQHFKVIYIGDHFQLPPVGGDTFNIMANPDFKMQKILRNKENDSLIQLSRRIRQGERIPFGTNGNYRYTRKFNMDELIKYDIVLTWTNKIRNDTNNFIRYKKGYKSIGPEQDEKLIIKRNNYNLGLFNGQIVYVMNRPVMLPGGRWSLQILDELAYNDPFIMGATDACTRFNGVFAKGQNNKEKTKKNSKNLSVLEKVQYKDVIIDWGYAITCHSAQGSSWSNVAIIDEQKMHYCDDWYRWMYTAVTRAEDTVVIYNI